MKLEDIISTDDVRISANTVTVKRNGKTCGIVRLTRFKNLQPNKASDYFKLLRDSGLWGSRIAKIDNVCIDDFEKKVVVFRNIHGNDYWRAHPKLDDYQKLIKSDEFYSSLKKYGVLVIECNVL